MHGSKAENEARFGLLATRLSESSHVGAVICVPFPYLAQAELALQASSGASGMVVCIRSFSGVELGDSDRMTDALLAIVHSHNKECIL
ncbi:hypothetical protein ACLKMY_15970 [Paraburkholderia mimosarum]|uniref:hypothetical protein n=1 Tax=Paraburkholderia mimosarum TaxID=312026 RepID=UPI0039C21AE1